MASSIITIETLSSGFALLQTIQFVCFHFRSLLLVTCWLSASKSVVQIHICCVAIVCWNYIIVHALRILCWSVGSATTSGVIEHVYFSLSRACSVCSNLIFVPKLFIFLNYRVFFLQKKGGSSTHCDLIIETITCSILASIIIMFCAYARVCTRVRTLVLVLQWE